MVRSSVCIALVLAFNPLVAQDAEDLCTAAARGDIDQVKALLAKGLDTNARDKSGETVLMRAVAVASRLDERVKDSDRVAVVRLLLDKGANVNARDKSGKTALQYARPPKNHNDDDFR